MIIKVDAIKKANLIKVIGERNLMIIQVISVIKFEIEVQFITIEVIEVMEIQVDK